MSKESAKVERKTAAERATAKPEILAGGNPQIAKADGDAPVQAYISAMSGWKTATSGVNPTRSSCATCRTCARP